jgi:uncharacterized protein
MTQIKKRVVLYHGGCKDGYGAAWAAHLHFKATADYIPAFHHKPLPVFRPESEIWFLDFCPRAQQLVELLDAGHMVNILDHHATTREILETVQNPNLKAVLDIEQSGAVVTWKHFFPRRKVPLLLQYVQDRDIWTLKFDETEAVSEALEAVPWTFDLWTQLVKVPEDLDQLVRSGSLLVSAKRKVIARVLERVYIDTIAGYSVPVVNSDSHISDVGNAMARTYLDRPFACVWFQMEDGKRKHCLRSVGDFDVAAVAQRLGGGGHKNSASFLK